MTGRKKRLKMLLLRRFCPTQACTTPRKLSETQQKYSVTEIELLAIVETLKEFKGMLWGQNIKVYTDHKNHTRDALGLTSDRVYRWRLLLEEYAPHIIYIKRNS